MLRDHGLSLVSPKTCQNLKIWKSHGISKMFLILNIGTKVAEICASEVWQNRQTVRLLFFKCAKKGKNLRRNQKVIIHTNENFENFFSKSVKEFWDLRKFDPVVLSNILCIVTLYKPSNIDYKVLIDCQSKENPSICNFCIPYQLTI